MKINQLLSEIHLKNISILEINNMQVEKDIFRLNEKYQILSHVGLADVWLWKSQAPILRKTNQSKTSKSLRILQQKATNKHK